MNNYHFIGIGGVGMSALAQAYLDAGCIVSGSDRLLGTQDCTPVLHCLDRQGVTLRPQDGSAIHDTTRGVIYSSAIEADNADLIKAKALGIPHLHRSEALAQLAQGHTLVAITGTCGKSSVTAMLGHLLVETGFDPAIINGAEITGYDEHHTRVGSVRRSQNKTSLMIVEADESDKSLMNLSPDHVIITNASSDHFPKEEALALFRAFQEKATGIVIDAVECKREMNYIALPWGCQFIWNGLQCEIPLPGLHNAENAYHALEMAFRLGADPEQLVLALKTFRGINRRLERVGICNGAWVVDDYAHNPEKLVAAWSTLAEIAPAGICGVWRPHGYAPLQKMLNDLAIHLNRCIRPQDHLLVLPVYDVGGTTNRMVCSEDLLVKLTCPATSVASLDEAEVQMRAFAQEGCVLVTLGARDPGLPKLAKRLSRSI